MVIKDRLIAGAISGMIGALAKTLLNYLFFLLGVTRHTYPSLIAMILLKSHGPFHIGALLIGFIIDSVIGGTVGILIIYLLEGVGRRYLWMKGVIFGNLVWLVGPILILPNLHKGLLISFQYISLLDHWVLGVIMVLLIRRFYPAESGYTPERMTH